MKTILITITILLFTKIGFSQDENLYFTIGHPFLEIERQFNSSLVKFENDTLKELVELSTEKEILYFIKLYNDLGKIVLYKEDIDDNSKKYLTQINISNTNDTNTIFFNQNYTFIESKRIDKDKSYMCLYFFGRKELEKQLFQGIRFDDFRIEKLNPEDYKKVIIIGSPGGAIQNDDYLNVYYYPEDGKLHIPITPKIEERPVFPIDIPDNLVVNKKVLCSVIINNDRLFVLETSNSEPSKEEIGFSELIIKNKLKNEFYKYRIKGTSTNIRNFDEWLTGSVVSLDTKVIKDDEGKIKERIKFNRISPGVEERRKFNTKTGAPFDDRTKFLSVYYPGILYLLNIDTRTYIEWNTGQGDSEILLIQDGVVYFRVNDKIYKVPIVNGKKLGESELLIKDERVPDIHWAFISEN